MDPIRLLTEIATAVGTVGAVAFAVWFQWIRERHRRPTLRLFSDLADDPQAYGLVELTNGGKELWLRLRVMNDKGKQTATDAQCILLSVSRSDDPSFIYPVPSRPLKWSDIPAARVDIPAGFIRRLDLGYIELLPSGRTTQFHFALYPPVDDSCVAGSGVNP